jgi:hypothetical protein
MIQFEQLLGIPAETSRWRCRYPLPGGITELNPAIGKFLQTKTTFMHHVMMPAAQKYQIFHAGFATIGPVMNVMGINKAAGSTTRETATAISPL